MTARLLLWVVGPLNFIFNMLWLTGEESRQTFKDKYVGTYVVRKSAHPIDSGPLKVRRFDILPLHLMFYEVEKARLFEKGGSADT